MSTAILMTDDGAERAWWQQEETAWCSFCWQGYAWELHVRCVGCDRPACPCCAAHEGTPAPRCPECASQPPESSAHATKEPSP